MIPGPSGIVFSSDYLPNDGGIARLCAQIAGGLRLRAVDCRVIAPRGHGTPPENCEALVETRISPRRVIREWQSYHLLRRRAANGPVICGLWYPDGLIAASSGVRPLVVLAHGSELMPAPAWRRATWRRICRQVCETADLVVANSSYTRELVLRIAPSARAAALPPGVDHRRFSPGDKQAAKERFGAAGKVVLSSVSRLHAFKGHETILRALAGLPARRKDRFLYLVAGTGPHGGELQRLAAELGLAGRVRFLGFVPEDDLPDLYRASDLFVLCTRESAARQEVEGFGLVFLEAQACGVPVVGARTGGIPDAVREGEGGQLIAQDDANALAAILEELAECPERFQAAGRAARRRVVNECTWDHYMQRFLAALAAEGIHLA